MTYLRAAMLAATAIFLLASAAVADDLTLTSRDGALAVSGRLLGYDGEVYRLSSEFGDLTVAADAVICAGESCPEPGRFVAEWRIAGARPGIDVLVPALLEAFAAQKGLNPVREDEDASRFVYTLRAADSDAAVARIGFRVATAGEGFADLVAGAADFAVAAREPDATERAAATEAGIGLLTDPAQSRLLALDALVAVVRPGAGRYAITRDELAALIAAPDGTAVHVPAPGTTVAQALAERLLAPPSGARVGAAVTRHSDPQDIVRAVSRDADAVGLTLMSDAANLRPLALEGTCGARMAAGTRQIKAEDYPLTVAHYLYLPRRRFPALAREFVAFATSQGAQDAVRAAGFVDQAVEATPLAAQGERLARAILATSEDVDARALRRLAGELTGAARLTPTFRFQDGSADLDAPSRANIALVAQAIAGGAFEGGGLLVAGFSDGLGGAAANLALSAERAQAVRAALEAALPPEVRGTVDFADQGFGETSPIACDEDAWGRSVNRRVELWLRQR